MSESHDALAHSQRLLSQLRAGKLGSYLEIHRVMVTAGLHARDLGTTDESLRALWRDGILAEARIALDELKRGDRNQYLEVVKTLALIGAGPEAIGSSHEELRALWRKAAFIAARECLERLRDGEFLAYEELLDHLAFLDADPEVLGATIDDMRRLRETAMRAQGLLRVAPPAERLPEL